MSPIARSLSFIQRIDALCILAFVVLVVSFESFLSSMSNFCLHLRNVADAEVPSDLLEGGR